MTAQLIGFDAVVYSVLDLSQQNVLFAINFISDDFVVMRLVTCVRVPILVVLPYLHRARARVNVGLVSSGEKYAIFQNEGRPKNRKKKKQSLEQTDVKNGNINEIESLLAVFCVSAAVVMTEL